MAVDRGSLPPVDPFRVVNIGNLEKVRLLDFIDTIEAEPGQKAICDYMPMQTGDVPETWAKPAVLQQLTGYCPHIPFQEDVARFVKWCHVYYDT